jgi:hypothetical protein
LKPRPSGRGFAVRGRRAAAAGTKIERGPAVAAIDNVGAAPNVVGTSHGELISFYLPL